MAKLIRARMLVEINPDACYVNDEYRQGYGETETAAIWPTIWTKILKTWWGPAIEAESRGKIVGKLQIVRNVGTRHTTRAVYSSNYDSSEEILSRSCVHVDPKRGIR